MFKKQSGVTLVEVLVTLLITTVGLLGLAALQLSALQSTADSAQRSQAVWLMQDLIERMRANPAGGVDDYLGNNNEIDCTGGYPEKMCASYMNTAGQVVKAGQCDAVEMATFDRWETQCQYSDDSAINYTSRDSIISTADGESILTITALGGGADEAEMSLTARWLLRGKDKDKDKDGASTIDVAFAQEIKR